jgi:hypothetical protein
MTSAIRNRYSAPLLWFTAFAVALSLLLTTTDGRDGELLPERGLSSGVAVPVDLYGEMAMNRWVVRLYGDPLDPSAAQLRCYGILIDSGFVLTTASCVTDRKLRSLRFVDVPDGGPALSIRAVVLPRGWQVDAGGPDLALVVLTKVNQASLPALSEFHLGDALAHADERGSSELLVADGIGVALHPRFDHARQLATLPAGKTSNICVAGPGWPLLSVTDAGVVRVVGLSSLASSCDEGSAVWELLGPTWLWVRQAVECSSQHLGRVPSGGSAPSSLSCRYVAVNHI